MTGRGRLNWRPLSIRIAPPSPRNRSFLRSGLNAAIIRRFGRRCALGSWPRRNNRPAKGLGLWSHFAEQQMKILAHSESHIVKLSDGSVWQIYPGDIDLTLGWLPTTEIQLFEINDHVASHGLINCDDGSVVRVRPPGERWPAERVKALLKDG
jgi:hypothetical protein